MSDETKSFSEMLEESFSKSVRSYEPGEVVSGTIINYDENVVFVDIGAKSEAVADRIEFEDVSQIQPGTKMKFYVVNDSPSEIEITAKIGLGRVTQQLVKFAFDNELPVFGRVLKLLDKGFTIDCNGIEGFCPFSQYDVRRRDYTAAMVGSVEKFLVTECTSRRILFSRRTLLEKEQELAEQIQQKRLAPGQRHDGVITRIAEFGVFASIDGIEGLVPRSELGLSRSVNPDDFTPGDKICLTIVTLDWQNKKHLFSIKQSERDPWLDADKYTPGSEWKATITGIIKEGAFAEIEPGMTGLIHISNMSRISRVKDVSSVLKVGQQVSVSVNECNTKQHRLSLALVSDEADPWQVNGETISAIQSAVIEEQSLRGVFARLENGMRVFVPARELKAADMKRDYPEGKSIEIFLTEIDHENRKVSGSEKQAEAQKESADLANFINSQQQPASSSSTLGALLGDKLANLKQKLG